MKIGIDLDGVVFNTEIVWMTFAELYDCIELKKNSIVSKEEPRVQEKYNWSEKELNGYLDKYLDIKDFDIVPGAKEVIKLLKQDGHELIVVTARGEIQNSKEGINIAKQRLEDENIIFDKYYWNQKNKVEICQKEKIDIMIDDNYHICEAMSKNNILALYFKSLGRKTLKESDTLLEVSTWGEIYRIINGRSKKN